MRSSSSMTVLGTATSWLTASRSAALTCWGDPLPKLTSSQFSTSRSEISKVAPTESLGDRHAERDQCGVVTLRVKMICGTSSDGLA